MIACVVAIVVPLVVGGISAFISSNAMNTFGTMKQPPLSPPAILFPIVWTILYIMMGVSNYLIWVKTPSDEKLILARKRGIVLYGIQLFMNFCWSPIFFNVGYYYLAFIWLIVLWALILTLIIIIWKLSKTAACLLIPYLLWTTFAGYLNMMIAILNR
ncbi:MAG: tryptophan-rich sensory protein [Candidatus Riflebacteria bacterium]|nr:tryptophan-rich sensory protein [Candidatus Riflebacteria bacterium]